MRRSLIVLSLAVLLASCGGGAATRDLGPTIELTSPRAGARLEHSEPTEVRWSAEGVRGDVRLEVRPGADASWREVGRAPAREGRLEWTPDRGADMRIRLVAVDGTAHSSERRVRVRAWPVMIVSGLQFCVARMSDGSTRFWGDYPESFHEYGTPEPIPFPEFDDLTPMSAAHHLLGLDRDGRVFMWGDFDGYRDPWPPMFTPEPVPGLTDIAFTASEFNLSFAVGRDGRAWGWGNNFYGSVGDGSTLDRTAPVRVPALDGVTKIAVGRLFAFALTAEGRVLSWGWNRAGVLGDGTYEDRPFPKPISGLEDVVDLAAGLGFGLALRADGTVWGWGSNFFGQLADGTDSGRPLPAPISGLSGIVDVQAGANCGYALDGDGVLWAWGTNGRGQLGDGTFETRREPARANVPPIDWFTAGQATVHAITLDGDWIAWGSNMDGLLTLDDYRDRAKPVVIQRRSVR